MSLPMSAWPGAAGRPWFSPSFRLASGALFCIACCVADTRSAAQVAMLAALALVTVALCRAPLRLIALRLVPLLSFAIVAFVALLPLPIGEHTPSIALPLGSRAVSRPGAEFLAGLGVKSMLIVCIATALGTGLRDRDLLVGLLGLHLPSKVASLLYLMVRSVGDVGDEARRMIRARDARGGAKGLRAVRVAASMAGVLILRVAQMADTRAAALVSRGFAGRFELCGRRPASAGEWALLALGVAGLLGLTRL